MTETIRDLSLVADRPLPTLTMGPRVSSDFHSEMGAGDDTVVQTLQPLSSASMQHVSTHLGLFECNMLHFPI